MPDGCFAICGGNGNLHYVDDVDVGEILLMLLLYGAMTKTTEEFSVKTIALG